MLTRLYNYDKDLLFDLNRIHNKIWGRNCDFWFISGDEMQMHDAKVPEHKLEDTKIGELFKIFRHSLTHSTMWSEF